MNARGIAAGILCEWLKTGNFPDRLMESVSSSRAFVMEIVYGAVKQRRALEWILRRCSHGKPEADALPYLLTGLYQVLFLSEVEDYAAVNETVEASKEKLSASSSGFVNAVLRRTLREKDSLMAALREQPTGVRESHPDLLVDRWTARYGAGNAVRLCEWNNTRPQLTLRVNSLKTNAAEYARLLKDNGVEAVPHEYAADRCLVLPHGIAVTDLPGYADGLFSVQDPSTITPVTLLDPRPGESVLDACAAPGGKTMFIAELMAGRGDLSAVASAKAEVVAMDLHEDRLTRLRENLERMGLDSVMVLQADAARPGNALGDRRFDRILVDAPCTNTGVLRRRADARWRFSMDHMSKLQQLQHAILNGIAPFLKANGTLVYSTCSLEQEECWKMVATWLGEHAEFSLARETSLFPPETKTDGIYAAVLRRQ